MTLAFSYIRFSHPSQLEGDSLRRQTERARDYCQRNKLTLDTSLTLRDLGVSAFRGRNAAVGNFRVFLDAVKNGTVPAGSVLIVESFDRISRQGIDEGYDLIKGILKAGVVIVTLSPERRFDRDATKSLSRGALEIQLILERAAEESETKAVRVGAAWKRKKADAANKVLTSMTPGWVVRKGDGLVLDPAKAATVRRIFTLARQGLGIGKIARTLNASKVPLLGRTHFRGRPLVWSVNVVYALLTNRATFGEYQPHVGSRGPERKPDGAPVPGYYPAVITEAEYHSVRNILAGRATRRGRRGNHINLFSGMLKDARTGGSLTYKHVSTRSGVIIPVESRTTAGGPWVSFAAKPFEESIRSELAEVRVTDIAPRGSADEKVESLSGQLADLDALAAKWRAKMDNPNIVEAVAAKLDEIAVERKRLVAELSEAQVLVANPLSESWGAARAAGKALADDDSDEARERYRVAVRRAVDSIHVLFIPGRSIRVAAVQVWFKSGAHRDYLIGYRPARGRLPGETLPPESFASAGLPELDFRKAANVARLEKDIQEWVGSRV
jgi:DNA invertase Pin-like site-specific DNA recombinase